MRTVLMVLQALLSILLIAVVLLQSRGTGLGFTFGGEGNVYRTKRGIERVLAVSTVVISSAFFLTAFTLEYLPL